MSHSRRHTYSAAALPRPALGRVAAGLLAVALVVLTTGPIPFGPVASAADDVEPATYIVTFAAGTTDSEQAEIVRAAGATTVSSLPALSMGVVAVSVGSEADVVAALRSTPGVVRAEADKTRAVEATPDDPAYGDQWSLPQVGWDTAHGAIDPAGSAVVAVLDTGVDSLHPDLQANVLPGTSVLDGGDGTTDVNGHGTAMAGIVAADTDNGVGIAGVGYDGVSVMPVTVLDEDGTGQDSDIISGVVWATDHGADVILMAFSSPSFSPSLQAAVDYAWERGVVLVAATGNDGTSTATYPAGDQGVIGVSGTDRDDTLVASSNHGPAAFLAAPGAEIMTTQADGGYGSVSGTSAAAAAVAGAAALVAAADRTAGNGVVVGRLARNADPAGAAAETGNGRLNLARALVDTSDEPVVPTGVTAGAEGGPYVGPYLAAGNAVVTGVVTNAATGQPIQGAVVTCTSGCNSQSTTTTTPSGSYSLSVQFPGNGPTTITLTAGSVGFDALGKQVSVSNTLNGAASYALSPKAPANTPPVIDSVVISPAAPRTNDVLSASVTSHDAENNAVSYGYQWVKNGVDIPGATGQNLDLSVAGQGDKGDVIRVQVIATETGTNGASSIPFTSTSVTIGNLAPVATAAPDQQVDELQPITVDVDATDADHDTLTFSLTGGPGGASVDTTTGVVSWTPTEQQGPGTFTFTVAVSDGAQTDEVQFAVMVAEVNAAPVLDPIGAQSVDELAELSVSANATDADLPANLLTYSLSGAPDGAAVDPATGVFTWTPTEAQGPGVYTFDLVVTDDGEDDLVDSESVSVTVHEVNSAPVLAAIADSTVDEKDAVSFTASATDVDDPVNTLTYSLVGEPEGAQIDPDTGAFTWTPSEKQGGTPYTFTVRVSDGIDTDSRAVTIEVLEVNEAPVLAAIGDREAAEELGLSFTAAATDADLPANALTFSLEGAPMGASIDAATGVFTWTPTEMQGPGEYTFGVVVIDDGQPALADAETVTITVAEVNEAPVLDRVGDRTVDEQTELSFMATATDSDMPVNGLTFSLSGAPAGASIDPVSGAFTWTPTEAQGAGLYTFDVIVTDDGDGNLSDHETITVQVAEVNRAPEAGDDAVATDEDVPVLVAVLGNDSDPDVSGGVADAFEVVESSITAAGHGEVALVTSGSDAGAIRYTPDADWNGSDSFTYRLSDGEALSAPATVYVTVRPVNDAPAVTLSQGNLLAVDEGSRHTYAFTVVDVDEGDSFTVTATGCGPYGAVMPDSLVTGPTGGSFDCRFPDGPASSEVSIQVADVDGAVGTAGQTVSVVNVAPAVTAPTIVVDQVTGIATLSTTYSDPGTDTHTAHFQVSAPGASAAYFTTDKAATGGAFTDTVSLPSGCYSSITVTAFVTDSDGGSSSAATSRSVATDVYRVAWRDPIRDNERNIAKYGNVVPVKVLLSSSCSGTTVTSAQLFLTLAEGANVSDDTPDGTPNYVLESVSSSDSGNQMRLSAGMYIYNLATKGMTQGKDYTLRVRSGSSTGPIILRALLQPKKG